MRVAVRTLLGFVVPALFASSILAAPPDGKGKPGGGGDEDPFETVYIYSISKPVSLRLADQSFLNTRLVTPDYNASGFAIQKDSQRILLNDAGSILDLDYDIDLSGNVEITAVRTLLDASVPGNGNGGSCLALASTGHAAFSSSLGFTYVYPDGSKDFYEGADVPACAFFPQSGKVLAAVRDRTASAINFTVLDTDATQSILGTVPGDINTVDVAQNGSNVRLLISRDLGADRDIVEWEPGDDIETNPVIEQHAIGAVYTCEKGADGWPAGTIFQSHAGRKREWIELTSSRRRLGGSGKHAYPTGLRPAC